MNEKNSIIKNANPDRVKVIKMQSSINETTVEQRLREKQKRLKAIDIEEKIPVLEPEQVEKTIIIKKKRNKIVPILTLSVLGCLASSMYVIMGDKEIKTGVEPMELAKVESNRSDLTEVKPTIYEPKNEVETIESVESIEKQDIVGEILQTAEVQKTEVKTNDNLTLPVTDVIVQNSKDEESLDSLIHMINNDIAINKENNESEQKETITTQSPVVQQNEEKREARADSLETQSSLEIQEAKLLEPQIQVEPIQEVEKETPVIVEVNEPKEDKSFFEITSLTDNTLEKQEEEFKRKEELLELELARLKLEQSKKPRYDPSEWINITILKDANKYDQFGTWVEVKARNKY